MKKKEYSTQRCSYHIDREEEIAILMPTTFISIIPLPLPLEMLEFI